MDRLNLERSRQAWAQALDLIPSGTQMMSKTPGQFVDGEYPYYVKSGRGCRLQDLDGNEYIDTFSAFGTVLLGYGHEGVNAAVRKQLEDGIVFSLPHELEARVAALMKDLVPCAEMSRFFKTGSEATSAAVRLARAFTGRRLIAKCASGYHGWHDWHAAAMPRDAGILPENRAAIVEFPYNDLAAAETLFRNHPGAVACIIMEPVVLDEPNAGFLQGLKELAEREGAILIFDEIVSGMRVASGGAQAHYGVTPHLAVFGKGIANGLPLAVLSGARAVMERLSGPDIFVSSTFGGETISLAAAEVVLTSLEPASVAATIHARGRQLRDGIADAAAEFAVPVRIRGIPARMILEFGAAGSATVAEVRAFFLRECIRRGVLFGNIILLNAAHEVADIDAVVRVARAAMQQLSSALASGDLSSRLEGEVGGAIFNPRSN